MLSNLSRHRQLSAAEFTKEEEFLSMLVIVLDHTLRDLVFYSVGIIINMSLHEEVRPALLKLPVVDKLIDVLRDANLEDMDLAKVAAKAIHNLQGVQNTNNFWSEDAVAKLDEFTRTFGEELDEIMVSIAFILQKINKICVLSTGCGNRRRIGADTGAARPFKLTC